MRTRCKVAGEIDVRVGGGVSTVQQFLRAQLIDEMHLALAAVLLGEGRRKKSAGRPQRFR
jgi:dihydrofolate reductase